MNDQNEHLVLWIIGRSINKRYYLISIRIYESSIRRRTISHKLNV